MSFRPVSSRQKPCREAGVALGHQLSIEYYDCRSSVLADTAAMEEIFLRAAQRAKATIISSHFSRIFATGRQRGGDHFRIAFCGARVAGI